MNKCRDEFHRWIIDEWIKIGRPWLWVHKCGKMYIIYDIGRASKVQGEHVGDKRRRNG